MTEKSMKPATKRAPARKPRAKRSQPHHHEISQRAYFIYLEEGGRDELAHWLRAERELTAA